ncbi:SIR2 family protein [Chryseobacterium sp. CP-77]|uniref:SIR2 family protein n=1 Tax=Chryseobacterium sp. CP-77 TaxID=3116594 RepID=UPI002ED56269
MPLFFYKGNENTIEYKNTQSENVPTQKIKDAFLKVLDNKNLSFLLGSGCSSYEIENKSEAGTDSQNVKIQVGIPIMVPMAKEFYGSEAFREKKEWLKSSLKIDVDASPFATNLETFLSTLHNLSFYHLSILSDHDKKEAVTIINEGKKEFAIRTDFQKIETIIIDARNFLLRKCINESNINSGLDNELIELYKEFYRKLLSRNSTLPRLNIFTTNYDLYSERAMDLLGIHYVNGFTGGISKFFNPAIFNYALAEKMDLSQSKWSVIDNFFYLYKIHGSVNWIEEQGENKLFKVREIQEAKYDILKEKDNIMIHPTPLKYNASLGSPYSDLFREFQKNLMQNNNILITLGYSFSDEHINNIIFQAFTIPSFRLIVVGEPKNGNSIEKLQKLNDSRIWIVGGKDELDSSDYPLHYFRRFVYEMLPDLTADDLDKKMETTLNNLKDLLK